MFFSVTLSILVLALSLWFLWRKHQFSHFKRLGIPGPPPNMFFGNMWEISSKGPLKCHREWVKKYGRVLGYYLGLAPILLVADPELLKKIQIRDFHKFINRPQIFQGNRAVASSIFGKSLTNLRGKRWKEVRSTVTPTFTTSKMKMMSPIILSAIDDLMDNVDAKAKAGKPFNIYPLFQGLTMDVIGRTAFGIKTEAQRNPKDPFLKNARVIFGAGNISSILTLFAVSFPEFSDFFQKARDLKLIFANDELKNPTTALLDSCDEVITSRRKNPASSRPDLLQLMIDSKVQLGDSQKAEQLTAGDENEEALETKQDDVDEKHSRNMTDDEIKANSLLFFLAGYETTSTALAFMAYFLIQNPEVQESIREEVKNILKSQNELDYWSVQKMPYLEQVLTESLRIYPPIYLFVNREAEEDIQYGNISIKKGTAVQVPVHLLQHDPEFWEEPEKFNPSRFSPENKAKLTPLTWQPFGAGPRNCVGMRLALMEAKLAIAKLLQKYRLVASDETEKRVNLKISGITLTPRNGIVLRAEPI